MALPHTWFCQVKTFIPWLCLVQCSKASHLSLPCRIPSICPCNQNKLYSPPNMESFFYERNNQTLLSLWPHGSLRRGGGWWLSFDHLSATVVGHLRCLIWNCWLASFKCRLLQNKPIFVANTPHLLLHIVHSPGLSKQIIKNKKTWWSKGYTLPSCHLNFNICYLKIQDPSSLILYKPTI